MEAICEDVEVAVRMSLTKGAGNLIAMIGQRNMGDTGVNGASEEAVRGALGHINFRLERS